MNGSYKKKINIDGTNSLIVSVDENQKTVITELASFNENPVLIYAEKFNKPCDYLKTGIRKGFEYLKCNSPGKENIWKLTNRE